MKSLRKDSRRIQILHKLTNVDLGGKMFFVAPAAVDCATLILFSSDLIDSLKV